MSDCTRWLGVALVLAAACDEGTGAVQAVPDAAMPPGSTSADGSAGQPSDDGGAAVPGSDDPPGPTADAATPEVPAPLAHCGDVPSHEGPTLYVATDGNDDTGDGSSSSPYASITRALDNAGDGSLILVRPGEYQGRIRLRGTFAQGVTVRSETPYQARLRGTDTVVTCYEGQGITLEGFDIAHSGPGAGALVFQIQNLRDPSDPTSRITVRNNVLHDSYNNDILKINNGASDIIVEGNIFYNQTGSDEHMDVNSVARVTIRDNVFFNDFAGSGRTNGNDTSSYIVVKDSNGDSDQYVGSEDITIQRNVFLHYEGGAGTPFVLIGEDGTATHEARDVVIENNLLLGDSDNRMRASFGIKGARDVLFRNNTISGDLPSNAFAMRLNLEGSNPAIENARFYNNIWSDPTGTMDDFSDTDPAHTASHTLASNVYFNGGNPLPEDAADLLNPGDDASAVLGDPVLATPEAVALPRWDGSSGQFADGSSTTCEAHQQLVERYAALGVGSVALGAADPAQTPADDILGRARVGAPNAGAWQAP